MSDTEFTQEEIQLIIESLLYCASSEINHTKYHEDITKVIELAVKLRLKHQDIPLDNVYCFDGKTFTCPYVDEINKFFPEIRYTDL